MPKRKLVINVGLEGPTFSRPLKWSTTRRLKRTLHLLRANFSNGYIELHTTDEPTIVFTTQTDYTGEEVYAVLHGMADELNQDAIAALFYEHTEEPVRLLCGPFADRWEPFDPAKFIQPDRRV